MAFQMTEHNLHQHFSKYDILLFDEHKEVSVDWRRTLFNINKVYLILESVPASNRMPKTIEGL